MREPAPQREYGDSGCSSGPGVFIKTFGCQMNEYDSEKMRLALAPSYRPVDSAEKAALIIVNTCSVRDKAEQKLYSYIGTLAPLKAANPDLVVGVAGCVAQQEGERILSRSRLVDFVLGTHNIARISAVVETAKQKASRPVAVAMSEDWEQLPDPELSPDTAEQPVRALVAVQRGCNKKCSFCVVPTTRGPQLSRAPESVIAEVRQKALAGAREVLLLGQTVNSYGSDLSPRVKFETLLRQVAAVEGIERIRFTSPHPSEMRPGLIECFAGIEKVCPHVHLPLQSGSDRILKLMRRSYNRERFLRIVSDFRAACPEIAFSSDIIVGFPTESTEDFEMTLEVMRIARFQSCYSFIYSPRPNTAALEAFNAEQLISRNEAQMRLERLQYVQDQISRELNLQLVGTQVEVLVEEAAKKISSSSRGRTRQNALVEVVGGSPQPGEIVQVLIEHAGAHGLRGRIRN